MSRNSVQTSTLHKAIASVAEYLEQEFSPELFSFMDGGTTLDVCSEALTQCQSDPHGGKVAKLLPAATQRLKSFP